MRQAAFEDWFEVTITEPSDPICATPSSAICVSP
jgi:hypothetical protein